MDSDFAIAWVAFGHSFASQDESDQAMSCYRTARNILFGACMPLLSIGIEFSRINQLDQALQSLLDASNIRGNDPLLLNELGVVYYKQKNYTLAVELLQGALQACSNTASKQTFSVTLFNLASAYRKLRCVLGRWACEWLIASFRQYQEAEIYYGKAIALAPDAASYASLGLTYHVQGALDRAIECYHSVSSVVVKCLCHSLGAEGFGIQFSRSFGTKYDRAGDGRSHPRNISFARRLFKQHWAWSTRYTFDRVRCDSISQYADQFWYYR